MMTEEKTNALVSTIERNELNGFRLLRNLEGVEWRKAGCYEYFSSGRKANWLNGVFLSDRDSSDSVKNIEEILSFFRERASSALWRISAPNDQHAQQLSKILISNGVMKESSSPAMLLELGGMKCAVNPQLTIQQLTIPRVSDWVETFSRCFGLGSEDAPFFTKYMRKTVEHLEQGFCSFLGSVEEQPVCCASIFFFGSIPVIYNIGTIPEYRGKGYGTQMTHWCAQIVKERRYSQVALFSSAAGFKMYKNIGFTVVFEKDSYLIKPGDLSL